MDLYNIKAIVDFAQVLKADKAVQHLGESAKKADKETGKLDDTLSGFGALGGPVGEVAGQLENMKKRAADAVASVRNLATGIGSIAGTTLIAGTALTALAGSAGILAAIRFTATLDEITKLGEQFGYSASQVALLDAKLQGRGGIAGYEKDIEKVTKALGRADEEGNKAYTALERLGINAGKANDPLKVLGDLTEKYGDKVKSGNISIEEQAALQLALGSAWKETIFRQKEAADAMAMYNDMQSRGIGISKDGEAATAAYNDAMDGASYILQVVGSQLVAEVVPAFTGLINALVDSYKNGGLVKIAFEGIKLAANLVMVPIRALFNIFIQLDAAIQSVGKSIGALFAAIATRSLDPFKSLKEDLAAIWSTANSRTVGMWGSDSGGIVDAPSRSDRAARGPIKPPKEKKEKEFSSGTFRPDKDALDWEEQYNLYLMQQRLELEKLLAVYVRMGDPLVEYQRQQKEIENLMVQFPEKAEVLYEAWLKIQGQIDETVQGTKKAKDEFDIMARVADTAFKGLEDSLVSLATTGKLNFNTLVQAMLADIARLIIQLKIIKPLMDSMKGGGWGSAIASLFSKDGNAFGTSGVLKSAKGNVFDGPTMHGYKGGVGVLGEAGPEGVLPLKRNAQGQLGVIASGGSGGGMVQNNVITINVQGGNTNAETGKAISTEMVTAVRGLARQEIQSATRKGGLLNPI